MAVYRFRVTFEDYEDVYRVIDMPSKGTFLELHQAVQQSVGYPADVSSSFYVSNDQWKKGTEIAFQPTARKLDVGVLLMENIRLSKFIDDPHQKFYYVYNFDRPYDFHVELIKILKEEEGKEYPAIFASVGQAPKSAAAANFPTTPLTDEEDDDHEPIDDIEEEYGVDDEDEYEVDEGEESEDGQEEFDAGDEDY